MRQRASTIKTFSSSSAVGSFPSSNGLNTTEPRGSDFHHHDVVKRDNHSIGHQLAKIPETIVSSQPAPLQHLSRSANSLTSTVSGSIKGAVDLLKNNRAAGMEKSLASILKPFLHIFSLISILEALKGFKQHNPVKVFGDLGKALLLNMTAKDANDFIHSTDSTGRNLSFKNIISRILTFGAIDLGEQIYTGQGRAVKFVPSNLASPVKGVLDNLTRPFMGIAKSAVLGRNTVDDQG
jgi:hypothetical protein